MVKFLLRNLGTETRSMHKYQAVWRKKNWQKTLSKHGTEIEELLKKLNTLDIWLNTLQSDKIAKELIPEIWMDGYASITFASMGLYKYANMALRSSLETALRLVYFSKHPVEFEWWEKDSRWYLDYNWSDVWGRRYEYFEKLELFKIFEQKCGPDKALFKKEAGNCLSKLYDSLSGSIHTRAGRFQTSPTAFSPKYTDEKYGHWASYFVKTHTYVNILFALGFHKEFCSMRLPDSTKILDIGIGVDYQSILQEVASS
jgi:hypothetical protein